MRRLWIFGLIVVVVFAGAVFSQIPRTMSYQGVLTDADGNPVEDKEYTLTFKLYKSPDVGEALWTEQQNVLTAKGIFNVILGSITPLDLAFDEPYWLGITIEGNEELAPRTALTSSPYSLNTTSTIIHPEQGQSLVVKDESGENTHVLDTDGNVLHKGTGTFEGGLRVPESAGVVLSVMTEDGPVNILEFTDEDTVTVPVDSSSSLEKKFVENTTSLIDLPLFLRVEKVNATTSKGVAIVGLGPVGVYGSSRTKQGVIGNSDSGTGAQGRSIDGPGIEGKSVQSDGVRGLAANNGIGVSGGSQNGRGVLGVSQTNSGIAGTSNSGSGGEFFSVEGPGIVANGNPSGWFKRGEVKVDVMNEAPEEQKVVVWNDQFLRYRNLSDFIQNPSSIRIPLKDLEGKFSGEIIIDESGLTIADEVGLVISSIDHTGSFHRRPETFFELIIPQGTLFDHKGDLLIGENGINYFDKDGKLTSRFDSSIIEIPLKDEEGEEGIVEISEDGIFMYDSKDSLLFYVNSYGNSFHRGEETFAGGIILTEGSGITFGDGSSMTSTSDINQNTNQISIPIVDSQGQQQGTTVIDEKGFRVLDADGDLLSKINADSSIHKVPEKFDEIIVPQGNLLGETGELSIARDGISFLDKDGKLGTTLDEDILDLPLKDEQGNIIGSVQIGELGILIYDDSKDSVIFSIDANGNSYHKGEEIFEKSIIAKHLIVENEDVNSTEDGIFSQVHGNGTNAIVGAKTEGSSNGSQTDLKSVSFSFQPRQRAYYNQSQTLAKTTQAGGLGIWGYTNVGDAVAVLGQNDAADFLGIGVWGYASNGGTGVIGQVANANNANPGVFGFTIGTGPGVGAETIGTGPAFVANHNGISGDIAVFQDSFFNVARIDKTGKGFFNGGTETGGADLAEEFDVEGIASTYEPGDVIAISTENDHRVVKSNEAYSPLVIGVHATKPGVLLTERDINENSEETIPVGVVGIIPTKVSGENGAIKRGDMLVAASLDGHAMKGTKRDRMFGATIGKALEEFDGEGTGVIRVLVNVK